MKKKIVELWKWYFLGISELPIMWGVVAGIGAFVFWFIIDGKFLSYPVPENLAAPSTMLAVWLGATFFFISLHLYVIKKKITVFSPSAFQAVIIYPTANEPVIYCQPLWGKFDYKIFKFPKGFGRVILKSHGYEQIMRLELETQGHKVIFPFQFKMIWRQTPDAWDFHEIAIWQGEEAKRKKIFQLDECLQNIFVEFNLEEKTQELQELAGKIIMQGAPAERRQALDLVKSAIWFPDHIFPATISLTLISHDIKLEMFGQEYPILLTGV